VWEEPASLFPFSSEKRTIGPLSVSTTCIANC
jgi:hypothetical protein